MTGGRFLPRLLLCSTLCLALSVSPLEAAHVVSVTALNPRPFGYVIGDVVEQRVVIDLRMPLELQQDALPKAGRVDLWLERRAPRVTPTHSLTGRYEILLQYQVLNAPTEVKTIALPELRLRLRGGEGPIEESVAQWPITVSPITPDYVLARAGLEDMRPDHAPLPIDTRAHAKRIAAYAVLLALIGLYAAMRRGGVPFLPRVRRPFALACRDLRRLPWASAGAETQRAALRCMHRAFDETAGRTVFKEHIERFMTEHPQFAGLRGEMEAFYAASREEFFGHATDRRRDPDWLLGFAVRCRDAERRAG